MDSGQVRGPGTDVSQEALDAAHQRLHQDLGELTPPRWLLEEAFAAAQRVYDRAEETYVDDILDRTGLGGMDIRDGEVRMRIKYATELASHMVQSFDALVTAHGAANYIEQECTITDPAAQQAMLDGVPMQQCPPPRTYRVIIIRPGRPSPHQLRRQAEARISAALAILDDDTVPVDRARVAQTLGRAALEEQ
jgi:hypothetical protein